MKFNDFRDRPLIFVDLEMTGLDPTRHEILEIGALVVNPKTLAIEKEYEVKVQPEHIETADPEALKVNGYKAENWTGAKPIVQVLEEFNNLAPGGMIAGWNLALDFVFLDVAFRRHGIKRNFDYHALDVLPLAWFHSTFPRQAQDRSGQAPQGNSEQVNELKLSKFCEYFEIPRGAKHQAMADVKATYQLFRKLIARNHVK